MTAGIVLTTEPGAQNTSRNMKALPPKGSPKASHPVPAAVSTVAGPGAFLFGHILVYIGHGSPHETQPKPAGSRPLAKVAEGEVTRNLRVWRCAPVSPRMPTVWALPWARCRRLG